MFLRITKRSPSRQAKSMITSGRRSSRAGAARVVAMASSAYRPLGAGKADARARLELLADLLHLGEEARLVREGLAIVVHHDSPVDDHGVHAAPVGVVDEVVDGIPDGLPLGALGVEAYQVGLLAHLDGAELVPLAHGVRSVDCRHLEGCLRRHLA